MTALGRAQPMAISEIKDNQLARPPLRAAKVSTPKLDERDATDEPRGRELKLSCLFRPATPLIFRSAHSTTPVDPFVYSSSPALFGLKEWERGMLSDGESLKRDAHCRLICPSRNGPETMRFGRRYVATLQLTVVLALGIYTLVHIRRTAHNSNIDSVAIYETPKFHFTINTKDGNITIEDVLTHTAFPSLEQRVNFTPSKEQKLILAVDTGHTEANLQGCPDWNCAISTTMADFEKADVVMIRSSEALREKRRRPDQYIVFFTQESPVHTYVEVPVDNYFNMSLSYRHDSLGASPYGYTVRLAPESRQLTGPVINETLIFGKSKPIAWFVSHCSTPSLREKLVAEIQNHIPVDIYGDCGNFKCKRGDLCETMLDTDYYFYISFENSICDDYITEKLWNQGYQHNIIPIVLQRSVVERYVPPQSFIAVDDFANVKDLAAELQRIMSDKALYASYFEWRRKYSVIFLDGEVHDAAERPWGFCQLCRLAHLSPRPHVVIEKFSQNWHKSCEKDGEFVYEFLKRTNPAKSAGNYRSLRLKGRIVESALSIN
uniref:Fucosyltransferase n=1 Tax=Steinernema glaseri TaxID=37863 RepID=A0A1I8A902_9BILA